MTEPTSGEIVRAMLALATELRKTQDETRRLRETFEKIVTVSPPVPQRQGDGVDLLADLAREFLTPGRRKKK